MLPSPHAMLHMQISHPPKLKHSAINFDAKKLNEKYRNFCWEWPKLCVELAEKFHFACHVCVCVCWVCAGCGRGSWPSRLHNYANVLFFGIWKCCLLVGAAANVAQFSQSKRICIIIQSTLPPPMCACVCVCSVCVGMCEVNPRLFAFNSSLIVCYKL